MSRPGTTASGVSTFVSRDGDDEPPKVQAEQRQVINLTPEEKVHFFSLIRHNKVPEIEDLLSKVFVFGLRSCCFSGSVIPDVDTHTHAQTHFLHTIDLGLSRTRENSCVHTSDSFNFGRGFRLSHETSMATPPSWSR